MDPEAGKKKKKKVKLAFFVMLSCVLGIILRMSEQDQHTLDTCLTIAPKGRCSQACSQKQGLLWEAHMRDAEREICRQIILKLSCS